MTTTTTTTQLHHPKPRRVCFSFAAYSKHVIDHLKQCNIPVDEGLNAEEFDSVESTLNFTFPPDLRSILQEGLPVGPGFPNWRSSSVQQLQIQTTLPILGICKQVSAGRFWVGSWGQRPDDVDEAVKLAKRFLNRVPFLVPIYRNCYIPSTPSSAGNPVFYVHGGDVRISSFDVAGLFKNVDFGGKRLLRLSSLLNSPAWAAKEARRIEFWTELAAEGGGERWWSGGELVGFMEGVLLRLRDGGWKEEDVREMTMMDGGDVVDRRRREREGVVLHLRVLSQRLLRAGWSREDVVDSLGCQAEIGVSDLESTSWLDFQHTTKSCLLEAM